MRSRWFSANVPFAEQKDQDTAGRWISHVGLDRQLAVASRATCVRRTYANRTSLPVFAER